MENIVITIARQYGSGGKTVGQMVADELGIPFYSRDILRLASEDSGISEGLFGEADEKLKNNPFLPFKEGNYSTRKTQVCTNLRFKVLRNNASPILSEEEGNSGYRITLVKTQFSNVTFTGLGVRASTCLWGRNLNQQETFRCP